MIYCPSITRVWGVVVISVVVILALSLALIVYLVGIYNGLVSLRENVKVAWANIDVLLKQRHDELPKLVETCKRYMQFEQETLEKVMRARASVSQASTSGNVAAVARPNSNCAPASAGSSRWPKTTRS